MSKSKYEYVKKFEEHQVCLMDTFIVLRIDGKGFSKFSNLHNFEKPNDLKALCVMNEAAKEVCKNFNDIFLAYGQSDEYSFVLKKKSNLYKRRKDKIISVIVSLFTSAYYFNFEKLFLKKPEIFPIFDCRIICYPNFKTMWDYFCWRQVDCHINNLYNTCFWKLIQEKNKNNKEAEKILKFTLSDFKNEMLFKEFGINYAKIEAVFRKGSLFVRKKVVDLKKIEKMKNLEGKIKKISSPRKKIVYELLHVDLIQKDFWLNNFPELFEED